MRRMWFAVPVVLLVGVLACSKPPSPGRVEPVREDGAALFEATKGGDTATVQRLLQTGADPNVQGGVEGRQRPLHGAVEKGPVEVVRLLLEAGAEPDVWDCYGVTPLQLASGRGPVETVRLLLEHGADPNADAPYNDTALMRAAGAGKPGTVSLLLEHGADHETQGQYGTALHIAAYWGRTEAARALARHGAALEVTDDTGHTPLDRALEEDHPEVARVLLNAGAHYTVQAAAALGDTQRVQAYLEDGGDVNQLHAGGRLMHWAARNGRLGVIRLLLDRGADIDAGDYDHATPLHRAVECHQADAVRLLLARGAQVKPADNGWTPLVLAASDGDLKVVRALVEGGVDPNLGAAQGFSALIAAIDMRESSAAELLVELGADANTTDGKGMSALQHAEEARDAGLVRFLRAHGAGP